MSDKTACDLDRILNDAIIDKANHVTITRDDLEAILAHMKWLKAVAFAGENANEVIALKQETNRLKVILSKIVETWNENLKDTPENENLILRMRPYLNYISDKVPLDKVTNPYFAKVADNEPIFVLRAHDALAPKAVRYWADIAKELGLSAQRYTDALQVAAKMEEWPDRKLPD